MISKKLTEPRKQPRQARAKMAVEAILETTAHILETHGLDAVNTNFIAERAGVSIGTLYQYFPSKEAIVTTLIRKERKVFQENMAKAIDSSFGPSLEATIEAMLGTAVQHQLDRPLLAKALEYAERVLPLDAETKKLNNTIIQNVTTLLTHYKVDQPEQAAYDLVALTRGLIDAAGLNGETEHLPLLNRAKRAVMGYLQYNTNI